MSAPTYDPQSFWKRLTDEQFQGAEYVVKLIDIYLRGGESDPRALMEQILEEVAESRRRRPALRGESGVGR